MSRVERALGAARRVVDGALSVVAPRRAVTRAHFRRMEEDEEYREAVFLAMRARGYERGYDLEGHGSTATDSWNIGGWWRTGDAEWLPRQIPLTNKARTAGEHDGVAGGLIDGFVDNIVGEGIRPQSMAKNPTVRDNLEAVWRERAPLLDPIHGSYPAHQRIAATRFLEDGDVAVVATKTKPMEPVWAQVVERERVATPSNATIRTPGGKVIEGVEKDAFGRPQALWVRKDSPGDSGPYSAGGSALTAGTSSTDVSAFDYVRLERAAHVVLGRRAGMTRGRTLLRAVLQDLRDLDLLLVACLKRTQIAACLAAFITSTESNPDLWSVTGEQYGYRLKQKIVPGMMFKLFPGEKVEQFGTSGVIPPDLEAFVIVLARRIGAAVGVSWQTVLKDWSKSNYSSARTQLLEDRLVYRKYRQVLIDELFHKEWVWVMEDARLRGDPRLRGASDEDIQAVNWIAPGWQWIDPQKQAVAVREMLALGLTNLQIECASLGRDWQEVKRQRLMEEKFELELREELELPAPGQAKAEDVEPAADDESDNEDAEQEERLLQKLILWSEEQKKVAA